MGKGFQPPWLALKWKAAMSHRMGGGGVASENWERPGNSPLEPLEGIQPADTLILPPYVRSLISRTER